MKKSSSFKILFYLLTSGLLAYSSTLYSNTGSYEYYHYSIKIKNVGLPSSSATALITMSCENGEKCGKRIVYSGPANPRLMIIKNLYYYVKYTKLTANISLSDSDRKVKSSGTCSTALEFDSSGNPKDYYIEFAPGDDIGKIFIFTGDDDSATKVAECEM